MNDSKIIELYESGLSKRKIIELGHGYSNVLRVLKDKTRSFKEIGQLYSKNVTAKNKHFLDHQQLNMIYGSLLGDSSLSSYGKNGKKYTIMFSNSHCDAQYGYSQHMKAVIPKGNIYTRIQKSGYKIGEPIHFFSYRNKGALIDIFDVVMINGVKTINQAWLDKINAQAIAYWFMDDGTSCRSGDSVVIQFSTYCFSTKENYFLKEKLEEFGIKATVRNSKKGHTIGISRYNSFDFMELVNPIVSKIDCMKYKIKYPK